jgi:hypothetical protein
MGDDTADPDTGDDTLEAEREDDTADPDTEDDPFDEEAWEFETAEVSAVEDDRTGTADSGDKH